MKILLLINTCVGSRDQTAVCLWIRLDEPRGCLTIPSTIKFIDAESCSTNRRVVIYYIHTYSTYRCVLWSFKRGRKAEERSNKTEKAQAKTLDTKTHPEASDKASRRTDNHMFKSHPIQISTWSWPPNWSKSFSSWQASALANVKCQAATMPLTAMTQEFTRLSNTQSIFSLQHPRHPPLLNPELWRKARERKLVKAKARLVKEAPISLSWFTRLKNR